VTALQALEPELASSLDAATIYRPQGCEACGGTGFAGREAIAELIVVDDHIRSAVLAGADARRIADLARNTGSTAMRRDGLQKVIAGRTSIEEVLRAVGDA